MVGTWYVLGIRVICCSDSGCVAVFKVFLLDNLSMELQGGEVGLEGHTDPHNNKKKIYIFI